MAKITTYTSVVREGPDSSRHWATSDVGDDVVGAVVFRGDWGPRSIPLKVAGNPVQGFFVDCWISENGERVAAVKSSSGDKTLLVFETGAVIELPGSASNWAHAFGPGDRLYIQQDASNTVHVYGFDGQPITVSVPESPNDRVPLVYAMPYDSASGIHHVDPDGQPIAGFTVRAEKTVLGVGLSFPQEIGDWAAGEASVGLNGGIALVNVKTGARQMWPNYTPHWAKLAVIDGVPYVSISCDAPAPSPDSIPWQDYDPLPPDVVDGARRPVYLVACCDGEHQGPGHLHWSYFDGSRPHVEGGAWAWRDYVLGHPAAIIWHDTRESIDSLQEWPLGWPDPPDDLIRRTERDANGNVVRRFVGSMRELAVRTKATLALYHDANKAESTIPYGDDEEPTPEELTLDQLPGIALVLELNKAGINAVIDHQGYFALKDVAGAKVSQGTIDAVWRTEHWGLALYAKFGVRVMLTIPLWTGNPVGPGGAPAYPLRQIAELFHYQTQLVDRYPCVEYVMAFDWSRAGGPRDNPWLGSAWTKRVATTERPAFALPTPTAYSKPADPIETPVDPTPAPVVDVPAGHGGGDGASGGHKGAVIAAAAVSSAVAAAVFIESIRKRVKAGEIAITPEAFEAAIEAARVPVAEGISIAERELEQTPPAMVPAPRLSRVLAARAKKPTQ